MSSDNEGHVEEKFFFNPDLMEMFLPFLDSQTLLLLCKSKISCAPDILQNRVNPSVWNKMVDRSIPEIPDADTIAYIYMRFEEARTQILTLIGLVKMMQAKENYDANLATLTILKAVCEKSSDRDGQGSIQLVSPGHKSYSVTSLAFMLLEEVETSLGSTLQEIESIDLGDVHLNVLPVLASRVARQRGLVTNMKIGEVFCHTKKNMDDLLILSKKTETGRLAYVNVTLLFTADAEEGFSSLARALSPTSLQVEWVLIGGEATEQLLQAKRADLRTIFESLDFTGGLINVEDAAAFPVMEGLEAFERYIEGDGPIDG